MTYESPIIKFSCLTKVFSDKVSLKINDGPEIVLDKDQASKVACALYDASFELHKQEI